MAARDSASTAQSVRVCLRPLALQAVADRVALATQARRADVERVLPTAVLQQSLLPERLPTVPGLELVGRYLPSDGGVGVTGTTCSASLVASERLREAVSASHPRTVCADVLFAMLDEQVQPNDVALLALRQARARG